MSLTRITHLSSALLKTAIVTGMLIHTGGLAWFAHGFNFDLHAAITAFLAISAVKDFVHAAVHRNPAS